ncbi:MAG: hypothetical protein F4X11_02965 [Acidobacteria bacterium]|nr:hypothetical protein [Acidobacteriota bacterium]
MLGSKKHVIPDVVVFVNGLPLVVIECKSPTIGAAWKAEAVKQLRRYQEADTTWKDRSSTHAGSPSTACWRSSVRERRRKGPSRRTSPTGAWPR